MKQPLKSDTDAQLHQERVISVRKQAEIGISSSTRENVPDKMRTSWKLFDVTKFQDEIKIAQKTAATPHVPREAQMTQTMTSNKVPTFDARPRADSSAVASLNVADLEPASLK